MASIGDLFLQIVADASGLGVDIERKAGPEVDKAGKTLGGRLGASMKKNIGTAVASGFGAVLGAGFAIAAKGAVELDAATQRLVADTGLVGDEAVQAKDQIASLYRDNLQGFAEIGDALAKVHTDLGLTGEEAGKTAEAFLKFATATGQNAGEAVTRLDDVMDNWNLTADHAQEIMDKLIVSHQKYGGSISDNEVTLGKLAPAMQAANFQIDDGIALLGLFGAKGLDSERAAAAFSKALTKVKSPEELQFLIDDISNTIDPFERAQKAAALFGAKAGAQLANALGGVDFTDYTIGMGEAQGATEKAADAIESGFGAQFQLILKNAGGALAEFGSNFGPLLLVAGQFGPKFAGALGAGLGGIVKIFGPKLLALILPRAVATAAAAGTAAAVAEVAAETTGVVAGQAGVAVAAAPAAAASGTTIGTAMGIAAGAAMAAALVAAGLVAFKAIQDQLSEVVKSVGPGVGDFADKTLAELESMKKEIQDKLKAAEVFGPLADLSGFNPLLKQALAGIDAEIAGRTPALGKDAATGFASGIKNGTPSAVKATGTLASKVTAGLFGIRDISGTYGQDVSAAFGAGIRDKRSAVDAAVQQLQTDVKNSMTKTAEIAHLVGILTSKELADGMQSADPVVRAQADATRTLVEDRLRELNPSANTIGKTTNDLLAAGLKSKDPLVRAQAQRTQQLITDALNQTPPKANTTGQTTGTEFAKGLGSTEQHVGKVADDVAKAGVPTPDQTDKDHAYDRGEYLGGRFKSGLGSTESEVGKAADDVASAGVPSPTPAARTRAYEHGQTMGGRFAAGLTSRTTETAVGKAADDLVRVAANHLRSGKLTVIIRVSGDGSIGGRAEGGPVMAGVPYVVGERQPELFVPETNGVIIPHVAARETAGGSGGSGDTITVNLLQGPEVQRPADIARELRLGKRYGWYRPRRRKLAKTGSW